MTHDPELQALKDEVACLLGRCVVRLQQYERLMKRIVAHHEMSGPSRSLEEIAAERIKDASIKTLGTLIRQFLGSYLLTDGVDPTIHAPTDRSDDDAWFGMRLSQSLPAEDYVRIKRDLKELVELRNNLVHHFMEQHDLWTVDGCRSACTALIAACDRIGQHHEQLREWARQLDGLRQQVAEFVQSDTFRDWVVDGIASNGTVNWPSAGIVNALREASKELGIEGWTPVAAAGRWIERRYPNQLPKRYGCSSWRQVLQESRLFELRYRDVNGQRTAWYRVCTQ